MKGHRRSRTKGSGARGPLIGRGNLEPKRNGILITYRKVAIPAFKGVGTKAGKRMRIQQKRITE